MLSLSHFSSVCLYLSFRLTCHILFLLPFVFFFLYLSLLWMFSSFPFMSALLQRQFTIQYKLSSHCHPSFCKRLSTCFCLRIFTEKKVVSIEMGFLVFSLQAFTQHGCFLQLCLASSSLSSVSSPCLQMSQCKFNAQKGKKRNYSYHFV